MTTVEILGFAREPAWLPWAVQYFFLIGLSVAAFVLSLPGLVGRRPAWREVSHDALMAALVCGLAAPVALLADLHQPGRFFQFYLHPNAGSWMAWGSFFIPVYVGGLLLYGWLALRPRLAQQAARGGRLAAACRVLARGGHEHRTALAAAALLAGIGAALVLLYTGMEVMVVRARTLWASPLVPLLFVATAFGGGLGATALFAAVRGRGDASTLLNRWQVRAQAAALALLAAWLAGAAAGAAAGVPAGAADALAAMRGSAGWLATGLGLAGATALALWLARRPQASALPVALLALALAWGARWVVFIGGQGLPKIGATHTVYALPPTPDGLWGIVGTAGLCLALAIALTTLVGDDDPSRA